MFAVIILISVISLILMKIVDFLKKISMPWELSENKMEKKYMKKFISVFVAVVTALSFTGCGQNCYIRK